MKQKILFVVLLMSYTFNILNAQIVQKLILKNGSVLEGYVSMQRPGQDFVFRAERATIYMPGNQVQRINEYKVGIDKLDEKWIEWAERNDAFVGMNDNRTLALNSIILEKGSLNNVRVLEKGAKVKYVDMTSKDYTLTWDTIAKITVDKRSKTALSGIDRVYELERGGHYEGQYVEEVPGKTLSLYTQDGVVEVFQTKDVAKYIMKGINPNQNLFEQTPLLDEVIAGRNSSNGIIIEQNYSDTHADDNYLLLQKEDGSVQSIKSKDVTEYRKVVNPKYAPKYDILLNEGELVINRMPVNSLKVIEADSYIFLPSDSCLAVVSKGISGTDIIIETHFANAQPQELDIVKVNTFKGNKKKDPVKLGFTFEDIVKTNIQPLKMETSVNGTTRMEYKIEKEGLYVIYSSKDKMVIPFRIK